MCRLIHFFTTELSATSFMKGQLTFMMEKGVHVSVVFPRSNNSVEGFKEIYPNIDIYHVPFKRDVSVIYDLLSLIKSIILLLRIRPDILHLHTPKAGLIGGLAALFLNRTHVIFHMHGLVSSHGNSVGNHFLFYFERLTCRLSNNVIAVSHSLMDFAVEKRYCDQHKIQVLGQGTINGIDSMRQFNRANYKLDAARSYLDVSSSFTIGFVGRRNHDKGVEDFLKILSRMKSEELCVSGVLVGVDESRGFTASLLKKYGLTDGIDVFISDFLANPASVMMCFDVLLFPSVREGFGLVAAECNSLEIPVVAYDIPGIRDAVIHNETGLLVEFGDINALYKAIMTYYNDPRLKVLHGVNGRKRVIKDFNQDTLWESMFDVYAKNCRKLFEKS